MCKPLPGSRCVNGAQKSLDTAVKRATEASKRADDLSNAVRIAKKADDIEFNAERYENVSKSLVTAVDRVNIRKVYLYASSVPSAELCRKLKASTDSFGPYEKGLLKSEEDLMKTGKFLKKFQDGADAARKANDKRDDPADEKDLVKALDTKTYPKLYKDLKKRVDDNYASKLKLASSPEEKKVIKEEHAKHLTLLEDARDIAHSDARKVYEPKKAEDEDGE